MCALRHIPSSDVLAFVVDGSSEFDEVQWFIQWPETSGTAVLATSPGEFSLQNCVHSARIL